MPELYFLPQGQSSLLAVRPLSGLGWAEMPEKEISRRRFVGLAILALLPLALTLFSPGRTLFLRDHGLAFQRLFQTVVEAYASGSFPLWNLWTGGGEPLLADWNSMAASPVMLVFAGPWSFDFAYQLFVFVFFPIALFGAAWLGEQLGLRRSAALLAGILYALSGFIVSFNNLVVGLSGLAFAPWALGAALSFTVAPSLPGGLRLSLALALHGQYTDPAFLVGDALFYVVGLIHIRHRIRMDLLPRVALGLFASVLLALGMIGYVLLPVLSELAQSRRAAGFETEYLDRFSLHPLRVLEFFLPGWGGEHVEGPVLLTRANDARLYVGSIYFGAAAMPLLLLGFWIKGARKWLVLIGFAVALALGPSTPLHSALLSLVPPLSSSRFPVKLLSGAVLGVAFLVPYVWEQVRDAKASSAAIRSAGVVSVALALCVPIALSLFGVEFLIEAASRFIGRDAARAWLLESATQGAAIVLAGAACLYLLSEPSRRRWAWLLFLLMAGDLAIRAPSLCPTIDLLVLDPPPLAKALRASEPRPVLFVYDAYAEPAHLAEVTQSARVRFGLERLTSGHAARLRIRHFLDQDLRQGRSARWRALEREFVRQTEPGRVRLLARMGVNHLLAGGRGTRIPGLSRVASDRPLGGPNTTLYRIEGARPLLSLEHSWDFVTSASVAFERAARDGPGGPVWLERAHALTMTSSQGDTLSSVREEVDLEIERAGFLSARVRTDRRSLLVLNQAYSEGWQALVDGKRASVIPGDGLLVTVFLEPGEHRVVLEYAPESAYWGLALSSIAVALWLLSFAWARRRRR